MLRDRQQEMIDEANLDLDDRFSTAAPQKAERRPDTEPQLPFADAPHAVPASRPPEPRKDENFLRRRPLATALGALLIATAVGGTYLWYDNGAHFEDTDDAFIAARQIAIAPKVAGYVNSVPVTDNQHVAAGETIARIDDRDYRVALAQAEAQVAAAEASIANVDQQVGAQTAQIDPNKALEDQAQATLTFAQQQAVALRDAGEDRRGLGAERPAI